MYLTQLAAWRYEFQSVSLHNSYRNVLNYVLDIGTFDGQTVDMSNTHSGTFDVQLLKSQPTVSVELAAQALGVSRAYAYEMARTGRLPTIALGPRRKRVPTAALLRILQLDD